MRHTDRVWCGMVSLFALAAGSLARADDAVTLTRSLKEGATAHYKTTVKTQYQGQDIVVVSRQKYTIKTIKPNGETVVLVTGEGGSIELGGGQAQDQPPGPPVTMTYDKSGKLTDMKMESPAQEFFTPGEQQIIAIIQHAILPDKPVKPDDTWSTEMDDPMVKGKKMTIKDTYLGTEKRAGATLWKIKQTVEAQTNDSGDKTTIEVTTMLDPKTGQEVYTQGSFTDLPTQLGATISIKTETVQLKDDDIKKADADTKKPSP